MKNIFLIRHAESEANEDICALINKKDKDIEITDKGFSQCFQASHALSDYINKIGLRNNLFISYYSTFKRAEQTHDLMIKGLTNIFYSEGNGDIVEQDFGFDDARTTEEIANLMGEYDFDTREKGIFFAKTAKGESINNMVKRVQGFIDDKLLNGCSNNVIVVGHSASIRLIKHLLMEAPNDEFELAPDNTAISHLQVKKGVCKDKGWIYTPK